MTNNSAADDLGDAIEALDEFDDVDQEERLEEERLENFKIIETKLRR